MCVAMKFAQDPLDRDGRYCTGNGKEYPAERCIAVDAMHPMHGVITYKACSILFANILEWIVWFPYYSIPPLSRARLARGKNVGGGKERLRDSVSHLQGGHRIAATSFALLQSRLPPQLLAGKPTLHRCGLSRDGRCSFDSVPSSSPLIDDISLGRLLVRPLG